MTGNAIAAENLTKTFQGKKPGILSRKKGTRQTITAVDHVSFQIKSGSLFGMLGPNGAGKTTTVRLLSTLLLPDDGHATVNGFDLVKKPNEVRASIGVVSGGERGLYYRLTGRENLMFMAMMYNVKEETARKRINYLLELVELKDRADDSVQKYSRGMKQRLHLIRALLHDPPILLLDEPTLGLDPSSAIVVREFIKKNLQSEQKKTILLTTHYMEEADKLCDEILIIDHGKIVMKGTPSDLKSKVKDVDVIKITALGVRPGLEGRIQSLAAVKDVKISIISPQTELGEITVHSEDAQETLPSLTRTLVNEGLSIKIIEQQKPSLEDVFISVTGRRLGD